MTTVLTPTLHRSRLLVDGMLREAVGRMDPASRAAASYHLGWTGPDGRPATGGGGKALRPALALLSTQAAGAPLEVGLPGAVAVELVHNFSLLHDDVMDGDTQRRHRPTVWAVWGAPTAILTGDAMLAAAQETLLAGGSVLAPRAALLLLRATRELIRGQHEDLAFERRRDVTVAECLRMAEGKTGALFAASACIGAVLADGPAEVVSALRAYGEHVGLAFQLVDDLLGIWGDLSATGKPVLADLRARKRSLPVSYALAQPGPAGAELAAWFAGDRTAGADTEPALRRAADLVEAAGGRTWALSMARERVRLAEAALSAVPLPAQVQAELVSLARFVVSRES
jgi:geranylgeranyl diphosphate synthase type I